MAHPDRHLSGLKDIKKTRFPQIEGGGFLLIQPALSVMVVWG